MLAEWLHSAILIGTETLIHESTAQVLHMLDSVYRTSLCFITNGKPQPQHCELGLRNLLVLIYKGRLGLLPPYLSVYLQQ